MEMIPGQSLDRLRQLAAEHPSQVGMIVVVSVLAGVSVGANTRNILAGLVSLVGSILICVAVWPLIKRFG